MTPPGRRPLAMLGALACLPAAVVATGPCGAEGADAGRPPNVVLIVADDLGWSDLGCYGNDLHETPHLDRLAREGVRFTDAYAASPVCTPTRAAILTGLHPARLHMTIWRESALDRGGRRLLEPVCLDSLPIDQLTLAEVLRDAGFFNAHVGKWHLGRAEAYPEAHGFHVNIGGTLWGAPQSFWHPFNGDGYFRGWRFVPGLEPGGGEGDYLTDVLTDKAIAFMESQVRESRPFYLNLWFHSVHTPIEGKPELVDRFRARISGESTWRNPHYAAMVHSLDENVGRVLATLDERGIADETVVVFTSDNGGFVNTCKLHPDLQVADNSPLRSGKGSCYEGGVRVPLIIRWPGAASGAVCATPVISCDLMPTLARAVGGPEALAGRTLDGIDLGPLVRDPGAPLERDTLFFHYPHYYPTTTPVSALRRGPWKLLHFAEDGRTELYHLEEDPGERRDLAAEQPDLARRLLADLLAWRREVGALEAEPNPAFAGER